MTQKNVIAHRGLGREALDAAIATPSGPLRDGSGREFHVTEWSPTVKYGGNAVVVDMKVVVYVPEELALTKLEE